MNAPRRNTVITNASVSQLDGWMGILRGQINNILTALLLIAVVGMFVRWRINTAEANRQSLANELSTAARTVSLITQQPALSTSGADWIKSVQSQEIAADAAISNLLNSSTANASTRARALVLRGDLYWDLANLPPLSGAATEPNLRLPQSADALLQKSFDAYSEVVKNSAYADQYEQLNAAHLGLAAIAENRSDWKSADAEFQAVINDPNAPAVLINQAKLGQLELPLALRKMYIAPPSGIGPATAPVDAGLLGPMGPLPSLPMPTTLPATMPATSQPILMPASH